MLGGPRGEGKKWIPIDSSAAFSEAKNKRGVVQTRIAKEKALGGRKNESNKGEWSDDGQNL